MSDMKCPFCGQAISCTDTQDADEYATWFCPRCVAERNWCAFGNEILWQELIRTRKALDVAKERLKNTILDAEILATPEYLASRAKETLEEITALEQKE